MKIVRFLKGYRSYNAGETAGFLVEISDELIASGIAVDPVVEAADQASADKAAEDKAAADMAAEDKAAADKAAADKAAEKKAAADKTDEVEAKKRADETKVDGAKR